MASRMDRRDLGLFIRRKVFGVFKDINWLSANLKMFLISVIRLCYFRSN
jgi:hypothetical protein